MVKYNIGIEWRHLFFDLLNLSWYFWQHFFCSLYPLLNVHFLCILDFSQILNFWGVLDGRTKLWRYDILLYFFNIVHSKAIFLLYLVNQLSLLVKFNFRIKVLLGLLNFLRLLLKLILNFPIVYHIIFCGHPTVRSSWGLFINDSVDPLIENVFSLMVDYLMSWNNLSCVIWEDNILLKLLSYWLSLPIFFCDLLLYHIWTVIHMILIPRESLDLREHVIWNDILVLFLHKPIFFLNKPIIHRLFELIFVFYILVLLLFWVQLFYNKRLVEI